MRLKLEMELQLPPGVSAEGLEDFLRRVCDAAERVQPGDMVSVRFRDAEAPVSLILSSWTAQKAPGSPPEPWGHPTPQENATGVSDTCLRPELGGSEP